MDLDDEILMALGDTSAGTPTKKRRLKRRNESESVSKRRHKKIEDSDEDDDGEIDESDDDDYGSSQNKRSSKNVHESDDEEDDPEWIEVQSWDPTDLMGDAEDRRKLMGMSELEREMVLAERRKKVEALQERMILKRKLNSQAGGLRNRSSAKTKQQLEREKKGKSLESLRRNREKREKARRYQEDDDEDDEKGYDYDDYDRRRSTNYSSGSESDYAEEKPKAKKTKEPATMEQIQSIQVTRNDLERWVYAPFFADTVKGCYVRIGVGSDPKNPKERVYRLALIKSVEEYHRPYKVGTTLTKTCFVLAHGKAEKRFLFDVTSNAPFTDAEWKRYEQTLKVEGIQLTTADQVKRKKDALNTARDYIFTNAEIDAMIAKKKELLAVPANIPMERLKLRNALEAAEQEGDKEEAQKIKERLDTLATLEKNTSDGNKQDFFAALNARNRNSNFNEGREAERAVNEQKKLKGASDYDPFARRKTQPKHVIQRTDEENEEAPKPKSNGPVTGTPKKKNHHLLGVSSSPSRTNGSPLVRATSSPARKPTEFILDDDFLDSIDVSALEAGMIVEYFIKEYVPRAREQLTNTL